MWSITAARVVDLPAPVGPVTSTSPRFLFARSVRTEGILRSSREGKKKISSYIILNNFFNVDIKSIINKNLNLTKIGQNIFSIFLDNSDDYLVSSTSNYDEILFNNNSNTFKSISYNGVESLQSGTVIKIEKIQNKYFVTIQTSNDFLYVYKNLESIDCRLYEYLEKNKLIGTSTYHDNGYSFSVDIIKDNKYYSFNSL